MANSFKPTFGCNPLLTANTGPPFDITTGRDLYGDTLFNSRPGIASDANKPGVIRTSYGLLDPNPIPAERLLSRNFGRGPGQIMLNMWVGRTFAFGRRGRGARPPMVAAEAGRAAAEAAAEVRPARSRWE